METFKKCRRCGEMKPLGEFHRHAGRKDGHHSACKPCAIAEQQRSVLKPPSKTYPDGMKLCSACRTIKPLGEFWRNRARYDGLTHTCRECLCARYAADPGRIRDNALRSKFGMRRGQYAEMMAAQGGGCAICGSSKPAKPHFTHPLAIDHDHATGKVRGLLCDLCNKGIGQMRDNPDLLRKAADYLEKPPFGH